MHVLRPGLTNPYGRLSPPASVSTGIGSKASTSLIVTQNRLIGFARLRQVRVRNDSCTVQPEFAYYRLDCYGPYTADNEDTQPYGAGNIKYVL